MACENRKLRKRAGQHSTAFLFGRFAWNKACLIYIDTRASFLVGRIFKKMRRDAFKKQRLDGCMVHTNLQDYTHGLVALFCTGDVDYRSHT